MSLISKIKNYFEKELEIEKATNKLEIGFEELKQKPKNEFYEIYLSSYGSSLAYHAELALRDYGRALELDISECKKPKKAKEVIEQIVDCNNRTKKLIEEYETIFQDYKKNTGFKKRERLEWEPRVKHFLEYNNSRHTFWDISTEEYVESALYLYKNLKFRYEFMRNKK